MALGDKFKLTLQTVYDADSDGLVDQVEGIRDLDNLPTSPNVGELVAKDGKIYHAAES